MAGSAVNAVGTVATVVAACPPNPSDALRGWFTAVTGGGVTVYFGGSNVSASNGYPLASGGTISGFLFPNDNVYAVGAGTAATVTVFQTGR